MAERGDLDIVVGSIRDIEDVHTLWREYWDSLGLSDQFQNFAEELKTLPGVYALPQGRLLLARIQGKVVGTAALRPLAPGSCEAKRLYVRPSYRGQGIGRSLLSRLVSEAREAGYREMYGDTLPSMKAALQMYTESGFTEVGPYSPNATPDAIFLRLSLVDAS